MVVITCFIADSFSVYSYLIVIHYFAFWRKIKKQVCLNPACIFDCWCHLRIVWIKMCLYFFLLWCLFSCPPNMVLCYYIVSSLYFHFISAREKKINIVYRNLLNQKVSHFETVCEKTLDTVENTFISSTSTLLSIYRHFKL